MLALAFLVVVWVVGVVPIAEGFEHKIPKGSVYFAMAFSLGVELLNIRTCKKAKRPAVQHSPYSPGKDEPQ